MTNVTIKQMAVATVSTAPRSGAAYAIAEAYLALLPREFNVGDTVDIGIAPDLLEGTPRITERYIILEIDGKFARVQKENDPDDIHWGYIGRGFTRTIGVPMVDGREIVAGGLTNA